MTFGEVLAQSRVRRGVTQSALARAANINPSYLSRIESGDRSAPTREKVIAIAKALHMSRDEASQLLESAGYSPVPLTWQAGANATPVASGAQTIVSSRLYNGPRAEPDVIQLVQNLDEELRAIQTYPLRPRDRKIIHGMLQPLAIYAAEVKRYVASLSRETYPASMPATEVQLRAENSQDIHPQGRVASFQVRRLESRPKPNHATSNTSFEPPEAEVSQSAVTHSVTALRPNAVDGVGGRNKDVEMINLDESHKRRQVEQDKNFVQRMMHHRTGATNSIDLEQHGGYAAR